MQAASKLLWTVTWYWEFIWSNYARFALTDTLTDYSDYRYLKCLTTIEYQNALRSSAIFKRHLQNLCWTFIRLSFWIWRPSKFDDVYYYLRCILRLIIVRCKMYPSILCVWQRLYWTGVYMGLVTLPLIPGTTLQCVHLDYSTEVGSYSFIMYDLFLNNTGHYEIQ